MSKPRTLALIGLTCVMVGMCYFCTTLPDFTPRVVGWFGVCFFSLGFIVLPRQLFRAGPQVVIDERGLEDRRSKLGLVDWPDVVSLSVGEVRKQKFLCIEVVDPKKYLDRLSSAGRVAAQANRALGFSEITIGFSGLSHSTDEVMSFIRENHAAVAKQEGADQAHHRQLRGFAPSCLTADVRRAMTINTPQLLIISAMLFSSAMATGQDAPAKEIVVLSPFQVIAKSLEMEVHYSTHQGKKTMEYIRVKNVAKGSRADRAGIKTGDRIVGLAGWRLEGRELTALNRDFTLKLQDGEPIFILTVRRPHHDEERDVALPFPQKKRFQNESNQ